MFINFSFDYIKKQYKIGDGAHGSVYKAIDSRTNEEYVIKNISFEQEEVGIPSTAIREISILKELRHPNIVDLITIINNEDKLALVFDYIEKDLRNFLDVQRSPLPPNLIQSFAYQILCGLCYCHCHRFIHRDMKPQNILINKQGLIKICDFGLARPFTIPLGKYTPNVTSLWYRAPELLLGSELYALPIDIWSVGCILAEMYSRKPLFQGNSEIEQLYSIIKILGQPNQETSNSIYDLFCKYEYQNNRIFPSSYQTLSDILKGADPLLIDLISKMLVYDPAKRITAKEALCHPYFKSLPPELKAKCLPVEVEYYTIYFDQYKKYETNPCFNISLEKAPLILDESKVIKHASGQRMIRLGKRIVYHATTHESAKSILIDQELKKGKNGMFGAGIYFASNMEIAKHKVLHAHHNVGAYIECKVDFGLSLILDKPNHNVSLNELKKYNCNSVMGRSGDNSHWEFVVYESNRTSPIKMYLKDQVKI